MCNDCGCGSGGTGYKINGKTPAELHGHAHDHPHDHDHGHDHGHHHHHDHDHPHDHDHSHDHGHHHVHAAPLAAVHQPGIDSERVIRIERDVLAKNNDAARQNRARLAATGTLALNLMSSPGSGKTTLLVRAIEDLKAKFPIAVIEGDQQTDNDAERIRATGVRAIQINTGRGCHLEAGMVGTALDDIKAEPGGLLFIENVGNLVCPAGFDLGEAHKVVVLSVTEGEDKPLKYPDMFAVADLLLLNKADLLPHLKFDVGRCLAAALTVNPHLQTLVVSAETGEGMAAFYAWIEARAALSRAAAVVRA
ncbi:hydrogenase accessory protein HypB [Pleomorphomonas diazotrophica]|uniref:Hydrogenase maturation factor HypB n=1 Tax=Pleomorphomonas diazotrophica TaxID=1166257 RepID=A0A1I4Q9X4_9HYPH|nr:hydrogenase nickel incorporation protein HypB [Pleomorphomonas diazotrophica]PKR90829.1 hydrogenase accessory protein HypB [Pleomorphomonas diazotrophica]SFM36891.1 Hydrogenase nickel incorporation protein HypB [Pleomorphomonas diazotrophica]